MGKRAELDQARSSQRYSKVFDGNCKRANKYNWRVCRPGGLCHHGSILQTFPTDEAKIVCLDCAGRGLTVLPQRDELS